MNVNDAPKNTNLTPLNINGINAVILGTTIWSVALITSLISKSWLDENDRTHWVWIASSGVALGLLGYRYTTNRVKRLGQSRDDFIFRKFNKREPDQSRFIQDFE